MPFPSHLPDTRPASRAFKITKNTTFAAGTPCRALWIGTAGTLNFIDADGNTCTDFPAKEGLLPIAVASIQSSGTADDIWALY